MCVAVSYTEKNPLWLGIDMLEQSQKFTSQNVNKKARRFDNYTVVFFSGMYNNRK